MTRPLSFLHITTFYPPYNFGGDGMYVYRLAHALGDAGHQVDVIHCVDSYHLQHPAEPDMVFDDHPNVRVHGLRSPAGFLSPLVTQQTGLPLLKRHAMRAAMAGRQYDVVHFHNVSLFGPGVLALDAPGAIKLYTAHEYWLVCPTHSLWKFNARACESPECLSCVIRAKRPPQLWRQTQLLDNSFSQVDRFLVPSELSARMHRERGFTRPATVLPNFTEPADSEWRTPGPRPHANPYCLFAGRLETYKGALWLAEAWQGMHDVDLVIAGSGSDDERVAAVAKRNPRIRLLGAVAPGDLGPLYAHAVACVVPTLSYETFGTVVVEAFARKAPVIVADRGALPELVDESGGGLRFRTEAELRDAVGRLCRSPAERDALGARGYQAFMRLWSRQAHLERYTDVIDRTAFEKFGRVPWQRSA